MTGSEPYTIAEIASAHNGEKKLLKDLINIGIENKFSAIKIQIFRYEELVSKYSKGQDSLLDIELKAEEWHEVFNWTNQQVNNKFRQIDFIAEPYGEKSLEIASKYKFFNAYKLPTSDLSNLTLIDSIFRVTEVLYLGTGGSKLEELDRTISYIQTKYPSKTIKLIHGFQSYPTYSEDCDLWKINFLKNRYKLEVGFADHLEANNVISRHIASIAAIAMGANFIEKHINYKREEKKPDYYSALNTNELKTFLDSMKTISELIKVEKSFSLNENEEKYRRNMKKYAVANNDMSKGHLINREDLKFKRVENGSFSFYESDIILGKILRKDILLDQSITKEHING